MLRLNWNLDEFSQKETKGTKGDIRIRIFASFATFCKTPRSSVWNPNRGYFTEPRKEHEGGVRIRNFVTLVTL